MVGRRRNRCPKVLADLYGKSRAAYIEQHIRIDIHLVSGVADFSTGGRRTAVLGIVLNPAVSAQGIRKEIATA